jgi:hypothetical protein
MCCGSSRRGCLRGRLAGAGLTDASAHLGVAQTWLNRGALFETFGLPRPGQFAMALSGSHNIAARQPELSARMSTFSDLGKKKPLDTGGDRERSVQEVGLDVSAGVRRELLDAYDGGPRSFRQAYRACRACCRRTGSLRPYLRRSIQSMPG